MYKTGIIFFLFITNIVFSQDTISKATNTKLKWEVRLDLANRYLWRGQCWGGNYAVLQPTIKYKFNKKIAFGAWATTNFKSDYFYPDGSSYKGYQEIDFFLVYKMNDLFSIQLWDYYWPSVEKLEEIDNSFFNYGRRGVKTVDLNFLFDFTNVWLPFNATISTLVLGNDFRYDENNENPKQNFTTYFEIGYKFEDLFNKSKSNVFHNIDIEPAFGVVLNNQAEYYTAGDYDKISIVNLSLKFSKNIKFNKHYTVPLWANYVHNASEMNTEVFGRNFLVFGTSFKFE